MVGLIIGFVLGLGIGVGGVFYHLTDARKKVQALRESLEKTGARLKNVRTELQKRSDMLLEWENNLHAEKNKIISFQELQKENQILKADLQNVDIERRKLKLDQYNLSKRQDEIAQKSQDLGQIYLKENVKWISSKLTTNNFVNSKQRLQKVVDLCRGIGFEITEQFEQELVLDIKGDFEKVLKAELEREEQNRIKAQIREEQRLERESQKLIEQAKREQAVIQAALDKALQEAQDQHSEEIERLRQQLQEAEEKAQRAISQAQLTRSGHVYVLSNIGSFGKSIFKIGMTRRLEPLERVKELGSASVPFPFDVHMMISCDDAPTLENTLHKELHRNRVNKVNLRKEYFDTEIEIIRDIVLKHHGEVSYQADPEALEYYQSQNVSDEDMNFIEEAYENLEEDEDQAILDEVEV